MNEIFEVFDEEESSSVPVSQRRRLNYLTELIMSILSTHFGDMNTLLGLYIRWLVYFVNSFYVFEHKSTGCGCVAPSRDRLSSHEHRASIGCNVYLADIICTYSPSVGGMTLRSKYVDVASIVFAL